MEKWSVRLAQPGDLPRILEIYETARAFMRSSGNPTQWQGGYPPRELLQEDIALGQLFVITGGGGIHGVFVFFQGDDPTYHVIEDGCWTSDEPYGVIHRIAGDGSGGIFPAALAYARSQCPHLRIDTHADNAPMRHILAKYGFSRRGVIYTHDGTPRLAYDQI